MTERKFNILTDKTSTVFFFSIAVALCLTAALWDTMASHAAAQTPIIGERLTYIVSFGAIDNAGSLQLFTPSRGKLSGHDAIEYRAKIKTYDTFGAAFVSLDEARQTYADPETGYPLYVSITDQTQVEPKETTANYLTAPATAYDLLTLFAKTRDTGGTGSFTFSEGDKIYTAAFASTGSEKVKTPSGEFDTVVSTVESGFLTDNGITGLKINFTADEQKVPVLFRFKWKKRQVAVTLTAREIIEPEADASPTPTPKPGATPLPIRTPRPTPTPTPYVDDQPLSPDLPFALGEKLSYNLSNAGRPIGTIALSAAERKMFSGEDSLVLDAAVSSLVPGANILDKRDSITAYVDPDQLIPSQTAMSFNAGLSPFSIGLAFDQDKGKATFSGKTIDVPVGTHSLLSFIYAIRTMNLRPSKDPNNPVNDTRVAVFWTDKAYIFTLRPSNAEIADAAGNKTKCLLVSVSTGSPQLDQLAIKIWLSDDAKRLPLRISFGQYQADLISH